MRRLPLFTLAVLVIMFVVTNSGQSQMYSVRYNFGSAGGDPSQEGISPTSSTTCLDGCVKGTVFCIREVRSTTCSTS